MALGSKNKKKEGSSKGKKDNKYVTLLQVLEGKPQDDEDEAKPYVKANNYKGRLIWEEFDDSDEPSENSTFYAIKQGFISQPHEKAPEFVLQTIVVNLNNPKAAQKLQE